MNYLLLMSFLTIGIYLFYIIYRYGIQFSISETYYTIGKKWWFTLILWGTILPLMVVGLDITKGSPFIFLGGAAISFVAVAPAFKIMKSMERKIHMIGSYLGVGFMILSVIFEFSWVIGCLYAIIVIATLINIIKIKNYIWWIEVTSIYLFMLILLIN